jgi:hypothetical protein
MPSKRKSETARTNGAQSHGPSTPEGRAKSSRNSLRHGLRARSLLLPHESPHQFQMLLDDYIGQFQPEGPVENELVQTMAIARWRLNRILEIETNLFRNHLSRHAEYRPEIDQPSRVADAFNNCIVSKGLGLVLRYEGALNRSYDNALKHLRQLQAARAPQPNEPKPKARPMTPLPELSPGHPPDPEFPSFEPAKFPDLAADMRVGPGPHAGSS